MTNINEILHAWDRKNFPEDLVGLEETLATVNAHDQEARKWYAQTLSIATKSYYSFDMGLCDHMRADLERLIAAEKESLDGAEKTDRNVMYYNQDYPLKPE